MWDKIKCLILSLSKDEVNGKNRVVELVTRRDFIQSAAITAGLAFAHPVAAQTAADAAHLTGPDRMTRLIAGAKKEGTLNLYSSAIAEHMNAVIAGFEKKYGVKAVLWRGAPKTSCSAS